MTRKDLFEIWLTYNDLRVVIESLQDLGGDQDIIRNLTHARRRLEILYGKYVDEEKE